MKWVPMSAAVTEVKLKRGISLVDAREALSAACDNNEVEWYRDDEGDLFVHDTSLLNWLAAKQRSGKRPRLIAALNLLFKGRAVPSADEYSRSKRLIPEILKLDPSVGPTLDEETVNKAIEAYHADPKRSDRTVSD
jgi:hypothetical protein